MSPTSAVRSRGPAPQRPARTLEPIGAGGTRDCFAHPDDPGLCIKVPRSSRGFKTSGREARYLARVERRFPAADLSRLPRYRGCVVTDRGLGWVQDRVLDASGEPSATLLDALDADAPARDPVGWERALDEFRGWAAALPLFVRDLTPTNVCVRTLQDGTLRLVPIDGYLPRGTWHRWFPRRRDAAPRNAAELRAHGFDGARALLEAAERFRGSVPHDAPRALPTRLLDRDARRSATGAGRFVSRPIRT